MHAVKCLGVALIAMIPLFLILSQPVYASLDVRTFDQTSYAYYIDPGTGSIVIQILIGSVVGGLAMVGLYRTRVKNFLRNLVKKRRRHADTE
ncbi:MAG: hypothetical protein A2Z75_06745 [Chloroflexi bacterium RBG_13_50_10]|nr:MAG: hypothetical protein A2Z75_06745 [Chloroflexi bacterium RBG_13_50_10]